MIDGSKDKIGKVIERFGNNSTQIKYYDVKGDFQGVKICIYTLSAYYRIALPSVLFDLDKVI